MPMHHPMHPRRAQNGTMRGASYAYLLPAVYFLYSLDIPIRLV